jgi:integrase
MRQALAKKGNRTVLFLTSKGNPYSDTSFTKVMSDLRKRMVADGLKEFQSFHFHQSRATFGTELMSLALKYLPDKADAICFVRDAMLHKDESTTWKYVKFIERHPLKEKYASEFYKLITGKVNKESRDQALEDYANE